MRTIYHPIAKFCHWTIVVIVALQFLTGYLMPNLRHNLPNFLTTVHFSFLGMILVPLALALFSMRFIEPVEKEIKKGEEWMDKAATAMQYALYILLIIVPASGWVLLSMRHLPVSFFGLFDLPVLNISNPSFLYTFGRMHSDFTTIIGLLALGHIAAALFHHFILKDEVLNRMRPSRGA